MTAVLLHRHRLLGDDFCIHSDGAWDGDRVHGIRRPRMLDGVINEYQRAA